MSIPDALQVEIFDEAAIQRALEILDEAQPRKDTEENQNIANDRELALALQFNSMQSVVDPPRVIMHQDTQYALVSMHNEIIDLLQVLRSRYTDADLAQNETLESTPDYLDRLRLMAQFTPESGSTGHSEIANDDFMVPGDCSDGEDSCSGRE